MGRIVEMPGASAGKQTVYQEYARDTDDAGKLALLAKAQIMVFGGSRSGKSTICYLLADMGVYAANVPITFTKGVLDNIGPTCERLLRDRAVFVAGVYCDPEVLLDRRLATRRGRHGMGDLASIAYECELIQRFYSHNGIWSVDSSGRTVEALAADIFQKYRMIHGNRSDRQRTRPERKKTHVRDFTDDRAI